MRIIKYLFLLLLLSFVAITIFIATQKGNFTVESSKIINSPKVTLFNYVNDYKNWPKFSTWIKEDAGIQLSYSPVSVGTGSSFNWDGADDTGTITTISTKGNDSIVQKMEFNDNSYDVFWSFKDTIGGAKVIWKSKGKMDFMMKVNSFFTGGTQSSLSQVYDKSLVVLDRTLNFENNTYSTLVNGVVKKLETFYLRQSFYSKISDIIKNTDAVFPKVINFCNQNSIVMNGKPFIIYHTYDTIKNLTKVSFCVPIKQEIFTSAGSDILAGKLVAFDAVKTTLLGNYDYTKEALVKSDAFFKTHNLIADSKFSHIEIFTVGKRESRSPSKWVTEIYYPIKPKEIPAPYKRVIKDTIAPAVQTAPKITPQTAPKTPAPKKEDLSEF